MRRTKKKPETEEPKEEISDSNTKTAIGRYDKKTTLVKEASAFSKNKQFIRGYKARSRRRDDAYKALIKFLEIKPHELQTKVDLKEFKAHTKDLTEAIEDLNEYSRDLKAVVEDLREFVYRYDDAPLFFKFMTHTAIMDLKTGTVELVKIKR